MKKRAEGLALGLVLGVVATGGVSLASTVTLPFSFTANTTARASEVNANFSAVKTAVDDTQTQVTALAGKVAGLESKSGGPRVVDARGVTVGPYFLYPSAYATYPAYLAPDNTFWRLDFGTGALDPTGTMQDWILYSGSNCSGTAYYQLGCNGCGSSAPMRNAVLEHAGSSTKDLRVIRGALTDTVTVASFRSPVSGACANGTYFEYGFGPFVATSNTVTVTRPTTTWTAPLGLEL